ncbi:protein AF-9 isoform X3 [Schistocerca serialis cubense]|uniref:protein AF-9 isoform X3 n=1 Tax=Schistocerca serialis cubense TaxID=2023355 RepID=UPI00214F458B|nr:protein AF-9 isoform X3 [Schistocerca serialis cubense]
MAYSQCVRVSFDIGHEASIRAKRTPEGFTHDWKVFVRGTDNAEIQHFVEKVVFHLHETFPKPIRVVKEPPFTVKESGYAGFTLPIEIYFKTTEEPKKFRYEYDLHLQPAGPPIHKVLTHPFTFPNPGEELRRRLIKGGGVGVGTEPGSQLEKLPACGGDEQSSAAPSLGSKSKLGWDATKKHKVKDLRPPEKFSNIFGDPIKPSSSKVSPDGTKKSSSSAPSPKISPSSKTVPGSTGGKQLPHHSKSGKHSSESRGSKEKDKDKDKEKKEGKDRKDGSKSHHTSPKVPPPSSPSSKSSSHPAQVPGSQKQPSSSSSSTPPKIPGAAPAATKSSSSSHKSLKDDTTLKKPSSLAVEETKSKSDAKSATESNKSEKKKKDKKNRDEKPKKEKHSNKHESASKGSSEKPSTDKVQKEHKDKEATDTKKKDKEHIPTKDPVSKPSGEKEKEREKSKHSESNDKEKRHKHKKKDKSTKDRDREKQKEIKSKVKEREKTEVVTQNLPETAVDVIKQDSSSPKQDSSSPSPENTSSKTWNNNYSGEAEVQNHTASSQPAPSKRPLNALIQEMEGNDSLSDLSEVEDVLPPPRQVVAAPPPPPPPPPLPPPPPHQSSPSSGSPKQSSPAVTDPAITAKSGSNRATKEKGERSAAKKAKDKQPKEGKERKRKRHSSTSASTAEETSQPPPPKLPRQDSPEPEPCVTPEDKIVSPETQSSERVLTAEYVSQLRDLQRKIMTLEDNAELQKVVQVAAPFIHLYSGVVLYFSH